MDQVQVEPAVLAVGVVAVVKELRRVHVGVGRELDRPLGPAPRQRERVDAALPIALRRRHLAKRADREACRRRDPVGTDRTWGQHLPVPERIQAHRRHRLAVERKRGVDVHANHGRVILGELDLCHRTPERAERHAHVRHRGVLRGGACRQLGCLDSRGDLDRIDVDPDVVEEARGHVLRPVHQHGAGAGTGARTRPADELRAAGRQRGQRLLGAVRVADRAGLGGCDRWHLALQPSMQEQAVVRGLDRALPVPHKGRGQRLRRLENPCHSRVGGQRQRTDPRADAACHGRQRQPTDELR